MAEAWVNATCMFSSVHGKMQEVLGSSWLKATWQNKTLSLMKNGINDVRIPKEGHLNFYKPAT
jgi:hypothetical protein